MVAAPGRGPATALSPPDYISGGLFLFNNFRAFLYMALGGGYYDPPPRGDL